MPLLPVFILSPAEHESYAVVSSLESCIHLFLFSRSVKRALQSWLESWILMLEICVFISLDVLIIIVLMWCSLLTMLDMYPPDKKIKWKFYISRNWAEWLALELGLDIATIPVIHLFILSLQNGFRFIISVEWCDSASGGFQLLAVSSF